ncbi:MAG: TraY domain-containing protein [Nitrospirota bacterium]|nr:TraY domain-containing protein [Nitrospirota bacterium]MDH5587550.1 TraY domain-containing protein [Nitrospirota bacterium]MDH5776352.1 TraY domain-containing protein [Nitrospirota bacterium]
MATLRLSKDLESRLDHLAEMTGRTKTFYIRQLLEEHIDELEDRYIAEQRLETPAMRLSSQQMRQELGLDN